MITGAGLRAADIVRYDKDEVYFRPISTDANNVACRALRPFQNKESIVGKLFAKHIKLDEAKQFLQRAQYDFPQMYSYSSLCFMCS